MKILFDINHPADVHQYKNIISLLEKQHEIIIVARTDKDSIKDLLLKLNLKYIERPGYNTSRGRILGLFTINYFFFKVVSSYKPDILIGSSGDLYIAQIAKLFGKPSIILDDTEHTRIQNVLTFPFATMVVTPESYKIKIGKKQVRYPGTKELGYLSAKYFTCNQKVEKRLKPKNEKIILLRLISWDANHDINRQSLLNSTEIIDEFEKYGRVIISSEYQLPDFLLKYQLTAELRQHFHDVLYYSDLVISEGATTAVEAAILGTPSIYVNELKMGYTDELVSMKRIFQITQQKEIISKAKELLKQGKSPVMEMKVDINLFIIEKIFKLVNKNATSN
ncbi:MAG: DUF354 domain-containing protein [Bacteroidales bacterium]|nr:DUF354 domain-containing protein [Bacteroidales bacterium]